MAKTYIEIQHEIASLQKAAEAARQKEINDVIARIKAAIHAYGLTARDLGLGAGAAGAATARAAGYRDGQGRTWSGRGRRPAWVHEALAAGRRLEDLRA